MKNSELSIRPQDLATFSNLLSHHDGACNKPSTVKMRNHIHNVEEVLSCSILYYLQEK